MLVAWSRARPPHPSLPATCLGRGCLMAAGGRVPLLPDRAIYLINLVIKVATQVTWSLSHRLLRPCSPGFEGGGWPPLLAPCALPGVGCGCPGVGEP